MEGDKVVMVFPVPTKKNPASPCDLMWNEPVEFFRPTKSCNSRPGSFDK